MNNAGIPRLFTSISLIGNGSQMKEEPLRQIARDWLDDTFAQFKKHMEFEIFHGKGPLTKHLRKKFQGQDLFSVPNYKRVNVEPDIAGIVISQKTGQKLWIIAEVKGNGDSVSQADRRQAKDYAEATSAFRAFLISDGPLGRDVSIDLQNGLHSFIGMFENGQKGICYLEFIRYLEKTGQFINNKVLG